MKKRTLTYYLLSLVIGSTSMVSCGDSRDKLSREKMVEVLHDIQLAEAIYQTQYSEFRDNEQKDALIQSILGKHGVTQAQLDSSLVWYADNAEIYMKVNDSVISSLKRDMTIAEKMMPKGLGSLNRNSSILPTSYYLSGDIPTLTFDIDSAKIKNYPKFSLEFNTLGIQEKMKGELEVWFEYADTTIVRNQLLNKDDHFKIINETDTVPLKNISGYFRINSKEVINNKVLLYNIILKNIEAAKDSTSIKSDTLSHHPTTSPKERS